MNSLNEVIDKIIDCFQHLYYERISHHAKCEIENIMKDLLLYRDNLKQDNTPPLAEPVKPKSRSKKKKEQ